MSKLDVLIDMFFKELPWEKRVKEIARAGYQYIETWQGQDAAVLKTMQAAGRDCGVDLVSIVINSAKEDQVAPIRAENLARFLEQVDRCADNALAAGCRQGIVTTGQAVPGRSAADQRQALVAALQAAADKISGRGFRINLEPLNTVVDHVGYLLDDPLEGLAIVREVARPDVRLLYDVYHMTIMRGNQTVLIEEQLDLIGHFHAAGTPGRHEPF
ncbi:MAG: TIM barrel protein, partial [Lentisphaerae bacterium]|nr:TIM barrel protein [Lentisphaerota bacterium]